MKSGTAAGGLVLGAILGIATLGGGANAWDPMPDPVPDFSPGPLATTTRSAVSDDDDDDDLDVAVALGNCSGHPIRFPLACAT